MEHQINLIVEEGDAGKRLDAFVASSGLDLSRSYIQKLIKRSDHYTSAGAGKPHDYSPEYSTGHLI